MGTIFERTAQGATIEGIIGTPIGAIITGPVLAIASPIALPAACIVGVASAVADGASSGAVVTLVGGNVGAAAGTVETVCEKNN